MYIAIQMAVLMYDMYIYIYTSFYVYAHMFTETYTVYTLHLYVFDVPMDVIRISSTSACGENGMNCWVKKPTTRGARVFAKGGCCSKTNTDPAVITVNQQKLIIIMYQV